MKTLLMMIALVLASASMQAAHPLAGKWFGSIDTDLGQMQIGLELTEEGGKLAGTIKTPHGDWAVKSVVEAKGSYTVTFTAGEHDGQMTGPIKDGKFAGAWDNRPTASGTFELTKAQPKK